MKKPERPTHYFLIRALIFIAGFIGVLGLRFIERPILSEYELSESITIVPLALLGVIWLTKLPFRQYYEECTAYKAHQLETKRATINQQTVSLRHGSFVKGLCFVCTTFALGLAYILLSQNYQVDEPGQTEALLSLVAGFGFCGILLIFEGFAVSGSFSKEQIEIKTPWTGHKKQQWQHLVSVNFNPLMSWNVLSFEDGTTMRISAYLENIDLLAARLDELGY